MSDDEPINGDAPPNERDDLSPSDGALFGLADGLSGSNWAARAARALGAVPALGRIDGYELLEEIGRGGQGVVYKARQPGTGRVVALKRFSGFSFSSHDRERFAREIEALSRLGHPTVVTAHSGESLGEQPILVMEYVDGVPIDAWSDGTPTGDRPSVERVLEVFAGVCDGVAHSHQRGVIHRDIKPSNVLVGADGRPRLLDFGIARFMDEWRAGSGAPRQADVSVTTFAGTPFFAAPEQLEGASRADTLSDVYSLGALLYRILTGRAPFIGKGGMSEIIALVLRGGPQPPSRVRQGMSRELDWIVLKAMEVEPARRYQTVEALAADVRRFLRGEALSAHPPTALYRVRKLARQHRALTASAVLVVITLVAATGVSMGYFLQSQEALADTKAALMRETDALRAAEAAAAESSRQKGLQEAVGGFLQDMLDSANANEAQGRLDITVREVLDRASRDLAAGTKTYPPEVEAAVRMSIGRTYLQIGLVEDAERHLSSALKIRRTVFRPASLEVLESLHYLGRAYRGLGRLADAERVQRDVVAARRAHLGEPGQMPALFLAQSLGSLGLALRVQGKLDEAVWAYTEAMEIYVRELGEVNDNTVAMAHNLQVVLMQQGKMEEAETMGRRALTMAQQVYRDKPHSDLAVMLCSLGQLLWKTGNGAEGEPLLRQGLAMHRELGGETHARSADAAQLLAGCLMDDGRWKEAEPLVRSALAAHRALRSPTSAPVRVAEGDLARILCASGRFNEAEKLCTESIERGGERGTMRGVLLGLALALRGMDQFEGAQAALLEAWQLTLANRSVLGPHECQRVAGELADFYDAWDRANPGQDYARQAAHWRLESKSAEPGAD